MWAIFPVFENVYWIFYTDLAITTVLITINFSLKVKLYKESKSEFIETLKVSLPETMFSLIITLAGLIVHYLMASTIDSCGEYGKWGADSFRVSLFALIRTIFLRDYRLRRAES